MRTLTSTLAAMLLVALAAPVNAQRVTVQNIGGRGFAVHVNTEMGQTPEVAGQRAMTRACQETRRRGFTHMGVNQYRTDTVTDNVQTRAASREPRYDPQGHVTGYSTTPARTRRVSWGRALLQAQVLSERSALGPNGMANLLQIVDARSCRVVAR